ncbi:hypothetical protein HYV81_01980 [Candidatus Woesearchaeota archaeon]|nr:hypothetical protein [Candidatus Woesearchaeota archaeon]
MKLLQTVLSKGFSVEYEGKTYYINYTNSDGQTLALANRDYWKVLDEELEELCIYEFSDDTKEEREQLRKNRKLVLKLIKFCIKHFEDYKSKIDDY